MDCRRFPSLPPGFCPPLLLLLSPFPASTPEAGAGAGEGEEGQMTRCGVDFQRSFVQRAIRSPVCFRLFMCLLLGRWVGRDAILSHCERLIAGMGPRAHTHKIRKGVPTLRVRVPRLMT